MAVGAFISIFGAMIVAICNAGHREELIQLPDHIKRFTTLAAIVGSFSFIFLLVSNGLLLAGAGLTMAGLLMLYVETTKLHIRRRSYEMQDN